MGEGELVMIFVMLSVGVRERDDVVVLEILGDGGDILGTRSLAGRLGNE
jgi:hypothetical protein